MNCKQALTSCRKFSLIRLVDSQENALCSYNAPKKASAGRLQKSKEILTLVQASGDGDYFLQCKTSLASKPVNFPFVVGSVEKAPEMYTAAANIDNTQILNLSIELATLKAKILSQEEEIKYLNETNDALSWELEDMTALNDEALKEPSLTEILLSNALPLLTRFVEGTLSDKKKAVQLVSIPEEAVNFANEYSKIAMEKGLLTSNSARLNKVVCSGGLLENAEKDQINKFFQSCLVDPNDEENIIVFHALGGRPLYELIYTDD